MQRFAGEACWAVSRILGSPDVSDLAGTQSTPTVRVNSPGYHVRYVPGLPRLSRILSALHLVKHAAMDG